MASETPTISIKLLINQETNTVLLAEAGSDFVNTLHGLLKLPLGNLARLVDRHQSLPPGCLNNLYNSVQNLGLEIFRTEACKHMLLYPRNVHDLEFEKLKLNIDLTGPTGYFICKNKKCTVKQDGLFSYYDTPACTCGKLMNVWFKDDETPEMLYKGESMFFITDDLRVMKGFPGDLIRILLDQGIKNASGIEEKVVEIGSKEMTDLLIHSLTSKTMLSDVFLRKQGVCGRNPMFDKQFGFMAPNKKNSSEKCRKTSVKMVVRKSDRKIVFVEASEDFVDFLFSFLTIPLDSVLELVLGAKSNLTLGSISNLFRDLNTIFSVSEQEISEKYVLPLFYSCPPEFSNIRSWDPWDFRYLNTFTFIRKPLDPKFPSPSTTNSCGYVEKNTFVVTDDLVVKPLSLISSIFLLKELEISFDDVEQKVINIGEIEAIALLGACLWSSSVLSASLNFVAEKPKHEPC